MSYNEYYTAEEVREIINSDTPSLSDISSYPSPMEMVGEYYKTAGITPEPNLCLGLVEEEHEEWEYEVNTRWDCGGPKYEPANELKELADLVYVIYGYALSRGWDLDEALSRVHANNLGRMKQDDGAIKRNEVGKILKNLNYPKVSLEDLV